VVSHISRKTSEIWGTRLGWEMKDFGLNVECRRTIQYPGFYWSVKGLTGSRIRAVVAK
jgi:hypothetical protein